MLPLLPRGTLPPRRRRRCTRSPLRDSAVRGCTNLSAALNPSFPASAFSSGSAHLRWVPLLPHPPVDSPRPLPPGVAAAGLLLHPLLFSPPPLPLRLFPWFSASTSGEPSRRSGAAVRTCGCWQTLCRPGCGVPPLLLWCQRTKNAAHTSVCISALRAILVVYTWKTTPPPGLQVQVCGLPERGVYSVHTRVVSTGKWPNECRAGAALVDDQVAQQGGCPWNCLRLTGGRFQPLDFLRPRKKYTSLCTERSPWPHRIDSLNILRSRER